MEEIVQYELSHPSLSHTGKNRSSALLKVSDENVPTRSGTSDGRTLIHAASFQTYA